MQLCIRQRLSGVKRARWWVSGSFMTAPVPRGGSRCIHLAVVAGAATTVSACNNGTE